MVLTFFVGNNNLIKLVDNGIIRNFTPRFYPARKGEINGYDTRKR